MPKKCKYNWPQLKSEYINSQYLEATEFFQNKFGHYNEWMKKQSRGWTKDKIKHQERIQAKVIEKSVDREAAEMLKALSNIRAYFKQRVSTQEELNKLKVQDARDVWKILRIENNLPANIIKAHNLNQDADPEELLNKLDDGSPTPKTTEEI